MADRIIKASVSDKKEGRETDGDTSYSFPLYIHIYIFCFKCVDVTNVNNTCGSRLLLIFVSYFVFLFSGENKIKIGNASHRKP